MNTFNQLSVGNSPQTKDDWLAKSIEISELFSPTAPVEENELFSGRVLQLKRLIDTIFQRGQHVVIYGDRGVGKTSLLNIFENKIIPQASSVKIFRTRCYEDDDFTKIWERIFDDYKKKNGDFAADDVDSTLSPHSLLKIVGTLGAEIKPVFIFDEYDRITDAETKLKMAETIKLFSDDSSNSTIALVGVGRTIHDLIVDHESTKRAVRQIGMPRMDALEQREIITKRLSKAGMTVDDGVLRRIVILARGMPVYAHLLGMHAAQAAIDGQSLNVTEKHLFASLGECLDQCGESTRHDYVKAIHSTVPKNQYREILLACALAQPDEFGAFTQAAVRDATILLFKEVKEIPAFARHLQAFCSIDRGPILEKEGTPKSYKFRFTDPMMQSYLIIKGFTDGMIRTEQILPQMEN